MSVKIVKLSLVLLVLSRVGHAEEALNPVFTPGNGLSCGRAFAECDSPQCYDTAVAREFSNWDAFEKGFFRDEAKKVGLFTGPSDFTEVCTGYKFFTPEEKELYWLDFLKLMVAFESNFLWLDTFDDVVDGKIVTERGFFQLDKGDCEGMPEVQKDYCALHWPKVNARCALSTIAHLARSKGNTIDAIATHWGSMRSSAANKLGGRRDKLKAAFMQHPACKYTGPASAAPNANLKAAATRGRGNKAPQQQQQQQQAKADDPARPKYDRLTPKMYPEYPDTGFSKAPILPSYRPAKTAGAACAAADVTDPAVMGKCKRFLNWKHYGEVDAEWADKHPQ